MIDLKKCKSNVIKLAILLISLFGIQMQGQAQLEFKVNPIALLFEGIQLELELPVSKDASIATEVIAAAGVGAFILHGKYFFKPNIGTDKVYIGAILGGGNLLDDEFSAFFGFTGGYKWLSERGVLFEIAIGAARGSGTVVPYGKLGLGYRFKSKKKN